MPKPVLVLALFVAVDLVSTSMAQQPVAPGNRASQARGYSFQEGGITAKGTDEVPNLFYNGDVGSRTGNYQGIKNWWEHDIISYLTSKLYVFSKREAINACREQHCVDYIRAVCELDKKTQNWNPFTLQLKLSPTGLVTIAVNPVKLCNALPTVDPEMSR
jgi:hypothetical protein